MTVELAQTGGVVGALGLSLLVVGPSRIWRLGGLALWAAGLVSLAVWLAPEGHVGLYAIVSSAGLLCGVLLAVLFLRVPWALPIAVLACLPAAVPVSVGSTEGHLLVPLYAVVCGAAIALAWRLFWEGDRARELGATAWPLALLVGWSGIALAWSDDPRQGVAYLLLFVLPFGLLAVACSRLLWREGWVDALSIELAAMGAVFAAIGLWQYLTRNDTLDAGAVLVPVSWYDPVDSVFRDPMLYGRFLVVAILASAVVVMFARPLLAWPALGALVLTFAGLVPSFSQSSYVALASGLAVGLALLWRRWAIVPIATGAAAVAVVVLAVPQASDRILGDDGVSRAAGDRWALVSNGIDLARDHPFAGVGTGGFAAAYVAREEPEEDASDTTPVTIAAETGIPGLVLLAWLVAAALLASFRRLPDGSTVGNARAAFGLALLAIVVQSVFDNRLLESPLFWGLLGLTAVAGRERRA